MFYEYEKWVILWVAASLFVASVAEGQDSTDKIQNQVNKCVVELMDRWSSEWDARIICGLPDDLEIRKLPGWEICILPSKPELVANMTKIPEEEETKKSYKLQEQEEEENEDVSSSTPVS